MIIYADVLIILNLYINYFLIRAAALVLHRCVSRRRSVIAASIGAAAALVILLPKLPIAATAAIKLAVCFTMTLAAFGDFGEQTNAGAHKAHFFSKTFIKDLSVAALCVFFVSCVFAGVCMAIWYFFAPFGMVCENGVAYFNASLPTLAIFTVIAYAALRAVRFFDKKRRASQSLCEVKLFLSGKSVKLTGFADTGNSLRDPFTGQSVVVCRRSAISELVPENISAYFDGKPCGALKLVPCKTIAGEKPLPVFRAERILINGKPVEGVVGVCEELSCAECIFDPEIFSM